MTKAIEKAIPDSHVAYGKKRIHDIRGYAETKFGNYLICINVNRAHERFDVIVYDIVDKSLITEFEKQWSMCKVLTAIS